LKPGLELEWESGVSIRTHQLINGWPSGVF
jgi:hypothetical protein